jgi:hypothetical protein
MKSWSFASFIDLLLAEDSSLFAAGLVHRSFRERCNPAVGTKVDIEDLRLAAIDGKGTDDVVGPSRAGLGCLTHDVRRAPKSRHDLVRAHAGHIRLLLRRSDDQAVCRKRGGRTRSQSSGHEPAGGLTFAIRSHL